MIIECKILVRNSELMNPLKKRRFRLEDSVKTQRKVIGCKGLEWIQLTQDRVQWRAPVYAVMNLQIPLKSELLTNPVGIIF